MYLDERSNLILKKVVSNPDVSNKELESKYNLSRRQISYSFSKINSWLQDNNYPSITRTNSGRFIVSPILIDLFADKGEDTTSTQYIPSEKERAEFINLMLLSSEEELSLIHFSSALQVSKNTILRDMKSAQKMVSHYNLEIAYSRMQGYDVVGTEWNKRRLLIDVLREIFDIYKGEAYIQKFAHIPFADIEKLKAQINEVESRLELTFIDERIKILPYIIASLLKRIKQGNVLKGSYHIHYDELSDTKEFEAAEILIQDMGIIPKEERLFITLQLLTSNVLASQFLTDSELPQLKKALKDSLELFERKACILFKDKEALLDRLVLHMKPAYYRIKYALTTEYSILKKVSEEFEAIHFIVKDSIKPFKDYIGTEIPENEMMFITVFIGGHLINSGETISFKKKAAVVCPNGVSISRLMENTLRDLFPEFYFYQAFSIREFEKLDLEFDLVFSPVPLQTDKHLFIVDQFITDFEKMQLRQRVMQVIFGLNSSVVKIDQLLQIIQKHAVIHEKLALEKALQDYFSLQLSTENNITKKEEHLIDLITPNTIQVVESVPSWEEALSLASAPLLEQGIITDQYVSAMKNQYAEMTPNIVLRLNVAIPHARPDDGVHRVGMSLLKIKEGLLFKEEKKIHLIVVIAAVDKNQHLPALLQLMKLAEMNDVIDDIKGATQSEKIHQLIKAAL